MARDDESLERRLRALFLEELDENVAVLNRGLVTLEAQPDEQAARQLLADLFRAAHSLKGAAHSAGVPPAVTISDRLEERLGELRDGNLELTQSTLSALFADVDALADEGRRLRSAIDPTAHPSAAAFDHRGPVDTGGAEPPTGSPVVRVAAHKLDNLLDQAGDLRVSARRLETLAADGSAGRERAEAGTRTWLTSHKAIQATTLAAGDHRFVAAAAAAEAAWSEVTAELNALATNLDTAARRFAADTNRVVDATQELRMQPFGQVCEGLDRTVRDLAAAAGKEVRFSLTGAEMEIDRAVGTMLREPILHLLRNAVDHGIEGPEHRRRMGKAAAGDIRIAATVSEGGVEVTVSDDGAGVDVAALRHAADEQQRTAPDDDLELVFEAGLSTAGAVTEVSGRGIGLDAVRTRIEQLGGRIEFGTESGQGTRVVLKLPRTLSTLRALLVSAAGETVALPLTAVHRLLRLRPTELREAEGRTFVLLAGEAVPVLSLSAAVGLGASDSHPAGSTELLAGVVVQTGARETVVVVDALLDETEILVKALPRRAVGLAGILGATVLADGRPALVVSPAACVRAATATDARFTVPPPTTETRAPRVLLAEDTLTTRVLEQSILEGAGYDVIVAVDGAQAWRLLQERGADLVVTDINMPEMDGYALCAAIRASARFQNLPVVLVTSLADEDDRRRGLEAGANAYIVKSAFDQHALLTTIEQLL